MPSLLGAAGLGGPIPHVASSFVARLELKTASGSDQSGFAVLENHFVPEFYFEPWLDVKRHLVRFGWMRGKLTQDLKTPGQICYVTDLHTFSRPLGKFVPDAVEHWLTDVDTRAAVAIRQILSGGVDSMTNEQANHTAVFILSLIVRRPDKIGFLDLRANAEFQKSMAAHDERKDLEPDLSPETYGFTSLEDYVRQIHPGLIENIGRVVMTDIITDERYLRRVISMNWWTISFAVTSVSPIVTTDRPLVIVGSGLDDPNLALVLPLSPQIVLYLTTPGLRQRMTADGRGVLGLRTQRTILSNADKFAFGSRNTNRNLIARYLPQSHQA